MLWWTLGYTCLFQIWFPWCVCPGVGLLGHMAVLFPVFKGISTLFSIVVVLVCIPTNSVRGFPFLHTLFGVFRVFYVEDHVISKQWAFYFFFPTWIPFISFSALIAVARISKTTLNDSGESRHAWLVPDFRGNAFIFSPLRITLAVGLSYYYYFFMLRFVPSIPAFWRFFFFFFLSKVSLHLLR